MLEPFKSKFYGPLLIQDVQEKFTVAVSSDFTFTKVRTFAGGKLAGWTDTITSTTEITDPATLATVAVPWFRTDTFSYGEKGIVTCESETKVNGKIAGKETKKTQVVLVL